MERTGSVSVCSSEKQNKTLIYSLLWKSEQQLQLSVFNYYWNWNTAERNHAAPNANPSFFCQKMNIFSFNVL